VKALPATPTSARVPAAPSPPSPGRLWLFRAATAIAAPILLLGLVEVGLRVAGVGFRPDFTVPCESGGQPAFCENPDFTRRFFPAAIARQPTPFAIRATKPSRTFRIFIVGESAAQGDPEPSFGLGRFLEVMLRESFPQWNFEVVNTGIVAINSHALVSIAKDIARREPDLVIVYAGNNEVVGPYGNGTVLTRRQLPLPLIRASMALQTMRIGQLLSEASAPRSAEAAARGWRGMEMFLQQQVRASDPSMAGVYDAFRRNLGEVVEVVRRSGARVAVSTVASRLRDFAPLGSLHGRALSARDLEEWQRRWDRAAALEAEGLPADALEAYRGAAAIDPEHAELQYRMARCAWQLRDYGQAKARFALARDLDTLRFRADSRINEIVREIAVRAGPGVELVDGSAALEAASLHGVPAGDLFYEHAHLTPEGNFVLARALYPAAVAALPGDLRDRSTGVEPPSLEDCLRRLALTGFNRYRIAKEVLRRLSHPPFVGQTDHASQVQELERERDRGGAESFAETDAAYRAAIAANGSDPWLHYSYGILLDTRDVFLAGRGQPDEGRAIREYASALERIPRFAEGRIRLAEALLRLGRYPESVAHCREILRLRPNYAQAYVTMGSALVRQGRLEEASAALARAVALDPSSTGPVLELVNLLEARGRFGEAAQSARVGVKRFRATGDLAQADALERRAQALEGTRRE